MVLNGIDSDAFSNGQIQSKIWLCKELERLTKEHFIPEFPYGHNVWVYGGWYGMLSFLLLSRDRMPIERIRSFDIDPDCETIADTINNNWVIQNWKFKAITGDCNSINFEDEPEELLPNIIINTSSEHFTSTKWFNDIPKKTLVAIQSNDMILVDHVNNVFNIDEMEAKYPLSKPLFSGKTTFTYPKTSFNRYMLIGFK